MASGGGVALNVAGPVASDERRLSAPVFVSYATADRKEALSICKSIEIRGPKCWISCRDVEPGENYQEAIVHAIRDARALVLVFSDAANSSDEIKKELSLASRHHIPLIAFRIEDVEPSDAFAYELSTRQWIDAFEGWDKSIDALVKKLDYAVGPKSASAGEHRPGKRRVRVNDRHLHRALAGFAALVVVISAVGSWFLVRPTHVPAHSMQVRLAGFERLSPDLPTSLSQSLRDEFVSVFTDDAVVTPSTATDPPPGEVPAYALAGAFRTDGKKTDLTVRFTNERTGRSLWSDTYRFDPKDDLQVPHWAAVRVSRVIRCGLFAASTYPKPLPDPTLGAYLGFCANDTSAGGSLTKAFDYAKKVTSGSPDFSWGWSALELISARLARSETNDSSAEMYRQEALQAANLAIRIDPKNGEAYALKSYLIPTTNLVDRETLLKQALAARPLACGCEHHTFGLFLAEVGSVQAALEQYRRAIDVFPLNLDSRIDSAETLIRSGRRADAKEDIDQVVDAGGPTMAPDPFIREKLLVHSAPLSGDYREAIGALDTIKGQDVMPAPLFDALLDAYKALASGDVEAKKRAAAAIASLPPDSTSDLTIALLGALGANRQALDRAANTASTYRSIGARKALFYPSMRSALGDPTFPLVAERLGLMTYWRITHTKPDVCSEKDPPPFCRMI